MSDVLRSLAKFFADGRHAPEAIEAAKAAKDRGAFVAFHGKRNGMPFSQFDPNRIGMGAGSAEGHGYNLADSPVFASQYGRPLAFEVGVPKRSLAVSYKPFRQHPDMADRFAAAAAEAPANKWRDDAMQMISGGNPHQAYNSLIRAYGKHLIENDPEAMSRAEIGRRATESLGRHGVRGFVYDLPEYRSRGYLLFPGTEGQIRLIDWLTEALNAP